VSCRVTFARSARKELQALDKQVASRLFSRIRTLAEDPRPPGCRKLRGAGDLWRIRVGDYRVLYSVNDDESWVDVVAVRHRRDAYR
jgi:mRNA interferase RelE/StbE